MLERARAAGSKAMLVVLLQLATSRKVESDAETPVVDSWRSNRAWRFGFDFFSRPGALQCMEIYLV